MITKKQPFSFWKTSLLLISPFSQSWDLYRHIITVQMKARTSDPPQSPAPCWHSPTRAATPNSIQCGKCDASCGQKHPVILGVSLSPVTFSQMATAIGDLLSKTKASRQFILHHLPLVAGFGNGNLLDKELLQPVALLFSSLFFLIFLVLGIEARGSYMLNTSSTTELHPPAISIFL